MKKFLSMLLTTTLVGASIISSNCSALKYLSNGETISTNDSLHIYHILTSAVKSFFKVYEERKLIERERVRECYLYLVNVRDDEFNEKLFSENLGDLKKIFESVGFTFENEKELTQFRYIFIEEFEKNTYPDESDIETRIVKQEQLTMKRRYHQGRIRNAALAELQTEESKEGSSRTSCDTAKKEIPSLLCNTEKKPKKVGKNKSSNKKLSIKLDKIKTKQNGTPTYKIFVAGCLVATTVAAALSAVIASL